MEDIVPYELFGYFIWDYPPLVVLGVNFVEKQWERVEGEFLIIYVKRPAVCGAMRKLVIVLVLTLADTIYPQPLKLAQNH
jgi:hypothetical protein